MAKRIGFLVAVLLLLTQGCATSWDCHYDSTKGSTITCESKPGNKQFEAEVLPPSLEREVEGEAYSDDPYAFSR